MRILIVAALLGFLIGPTHAADAPKPRPEECLAQYFQLCPNKSNEPDVRACIQANRAKFSPSCLELAKGFK